MGSNPRYCQYNCDYMCSMCEQKEREDLRKSQMNVPVIPPYANGFNPLSDDVDDGMMFGYASNIQQQVDDYGELTGFPLQKYDSVGRRVNHTPYVPPPLRILKEKKVILADEDVYADSPMELIKGAIIHD